MDRTEHPSVPAWIYGILGLTMLVAKDVTGESLVFGLNMF